MPELPAAVQETLPKTLDEFKQMEEEQKNRRLPKTPEEQAEVEALAIQGPAAVYAWIFGPDSLMAKKVEGASWTDMGFTDPVTGYRQIIESLRQFE